MYIVIYNLFALPAKQARKAFLPVSKTLQINYIFSDMYVYSNFLIITNDLEVNSRRKKPFTQISLLITSYCPEITLNPYFDE